KSYRAAIQELKPFTDRAGQTDPRRGEALTALGLSYYFEGQLSEAIPLLKQASERFPSNAEFAYALGIACLRARDIESAGEAFTRKQMWGDAVAPLQKAIWLNPEFSSPYILLGKVYDRLEQTEFAEGMLSKAISMDPNNLEAHYLLGTIYRKGGRLHKAQEQFEAYQKLKSQGKE